MSPLRRVLPLAFAAAACTAAPELAPSDPEPTRARAALARLSVDNRTTVQLDIFYRLAAGAPAETRVGQVPGRSTAEMAPVPAGEPLILIARTPDGAELTLPPRTFEIDGRGDWLIPADARFIRPVAGVAS